MGSVYRKTVTKPLPEDAKIFTRDGERFARWQDSRGKTHKAPVKVGRKGARGRPRAPFLVDRGGIWVRFGMDLCRCF